ncbi:signal transduction histidine kinase [Actinoalloteichus sp. GBA129-24]|uniref:histidine kinase n=1 Tax=Actinoalloteichus fjordicus TaxID=1612552 RepID=A0AAC9PSI6_9PSEU|nr:signal transduction histidine kinase [Actinoalloteichus fjordicus]APU21649.1 signal transduction histidine kinase [Actinoalloteichus sp. GBA129-24]
MVRRHPLVFDAVVAVLLFVGPLIASQAMGRHPEWAPGPPGWEPPFARAELNLGMILAGAVGCAALVLRRRWPLPVLAATTVIGAATLVIGGGPSPYLAPALVAAYTVATLVPRRRAWAAGAVAALVLAGVSAIAAPTLLPGLGNPGVVAWLGIAVAVGDALSSRRAYIAEVEERARRAEQSREEEAARRVVAERMRIARELHDVVAHHIAVITVQAGVAEHLLTSQPAAAAAAVGHIRDAGHTVLTEMTTLLGVLRGAEEPAASTEPAPSLDRVSELVEAFAATGLRIELVTSGRHRPLPPAVDLAGYRIVQESLTNAHKHGRGAGVVVRIEHGPAELVVEVRNGAPESGAAAVARGSGAAGAGAVSGGSDLTVWGAAAAGSSASGSSAAGAGSVDSGSTGPAGSGPASNSPAGSAASGPAERAESGEPVARQSAPSGHGIVGMRERAVTVGGTLSAEPISGGGFRVLARLPIPSASAGEAK